MYGPEESPERKKASVNISLSFFRHIMIRVQGTLLTP